MKISISGTPGTGKTTLSKKLSDKIGWEVLSINDIAKSLNAYSGEDKKMGAKILNMKKIDNYLKNINKDVIIEGHTSHEISSDLTIILRCDPKILKKRLGKKYPENPEKIKENVDAEILGIITSDAVENGKNTFEIDTSKKTIDENVSDIINILNGKTDDYKIGLIDWLENYEDWLLGD